MFSFLRQLTTWHCPHLLLYVVLLCAVLQPPPSIYCTQQQTRHTGRHRWDRQTDTVRYDTIRDAILTCARKPTGVSLIYRTEPTTKKCKNRKTKSRKQICSEITVNSPGNPCSEYLRRRNEGLKWEGFAEKEGFK